MTPNVFDGTASVKATASAVVANTNSVDCVLNEKELVGVVICSLWFLMRRAKCRGLFAPATWFRMVNLLQGGGDAGEGERDLALSGEVPRDEASDEWRLGVGEGGRLLVGCMAFSDEVCAPDVACGEAGGVLLSGSLFLCLFLGESEA